MDGKHAGEKRRQWEATTWRVLVITAAVLGVGWSAAFPARAAGSFDVEASGVRMEVSAVENGIFHVVAYPEARSPVVQPSPFVVRTAEWPGALPGRYRQWQILKTPAGRFAAAATGIFDVKGSSGKPVIAQGRIAATPGGMELTFRHGRGQRIYGSGNAGMNRAGGLVHTAATSVVSNGAARIPFVWSTGGYAVLIANDTPSISWVDDGEAQKWSVPAPYLDLYLMAGANPYGLLDQYTRLTGRPPIPPRWTFGFMQSRWGYRDATDVQSKWQMFRDLQVPVDAFIYDYDWYVNDWDFNPATFPDPRADLGKMASLGIHFVGIRKPRVYGEHYDYAKQRDWILTGNDLNFALPEARDWWWSHQAPLVEDGVSGWWNDEAEQAYDEFFYMAQTEWDGWRSMDPGRAWSISRAFSPGMQRLGAAVWTGDISSDWRTLQNQPGTLLNFSLAGMTYCGQDIGGFTGLPSPELYTRWIEEGVFVPVMRAHGTHDSPRWPWAFGPEALDAVRKAIDLRYRLIPYLYSYASVAADIGAPIMRPLFLEFPRDPRIYNLEDEWMVGRSLLAAPILSQGGRRIVYLPRGLWYDFNTGEEIQGPARLQISGSLDTIPAYVRAGGILPLGPVLQYTSQGPEDPLEIRVYPGADGQFVLYEDNGTNYDYQKGAWSRIPFHWNNRQHTLWIGRRQGSYPEMLPERHLHVVTPNGVSRDVLYSGLAMKVRL